MGTKLLSAAILMGLCGCVAAPYGQPAPYYGGNAPYYGTSYAPAYVGVGVAAGGYYPSFYSHHIHSGYNNSYWHYQRGAFGHGGPAHGPAPAAHAGGHASGGHDGGHGH